jgi:hypothetical protein
MIAASNALLQHRLSTWFGTGLAIPLMLVVGCASFSVMVLMLLNARRDPKSRSF